MKKASYQAPEVFRSYKDQQMMIFRPVPDDELAYRVLDEFKEVAMSGLATRARIWAFGLIWRWKKSKPKKRK